MIFVVERFLPAIINWPIFIFLIFVILFMLTSKDEARDLFYIAIASIFFDLFSGFRFGFFVIALLLVSLCVHLFKNRINVNTKSFFLTIVYSLIFVFIFTVILSIRNMAGIMLLTKPIFLAETIIISVLLQFFFKLNDSR